MSGSQKKPSEREAILQAMKSPPPEGYYVWDGVDEDERPATAEELQAALAAARRRRGRPTGSTKTQIALRVDRMIDCEEQKAEQDANSTWSH